MIMRKASVFEQQYAYKIFRNEFLLIDETRLDPLHSMEYIPVFLINSLKLRLSICENFQLFYSLVYFVLLSVRKVSYICER